MASGAIPNAVQAHQRTSVPTVSDDRHSSHPRHALTQGVNYVYHRRHHWILSRSTQAFRSGRQWNRPGVIAAVQSGSWNHTVQGDAGNRSSRLTGSRRISKPQKAAWILGTGLISASPWNISPTTMIHQILSEQIWFLPVWLWLVILYFGHSIRSAKLQQQANRADIKRATGRDLDEEDYVEKKMRKYDGVSPDAMRQRLAEEYRLIKKGKRIYRNSRQYWFAVNSGSQKRDPEIERFLD